MLTCYQVTRDDFLKLLPELIKNYQAPAQTLSRISDVDLVMVVGASGVGKTSVIKHLGIPYVPTDTTRPKRPEEVEGLDYFFHEDYAQVVDDIKNRQFVQIAMGPTGDLYGTRASLYPQVGMAVLGVLAEVVPQFRTLGFSETMAVYITPPTFLEWMDRLGRISFDRDQLLGRLKESKFSFQFALNDSQIHFILNDVLEEAVHQTNMLLNGKVDAERESKARQEAQRIFQELTFT
jgi:guanylate kinase